MAVKTLRRLVARARFTDSASYWRRRYAGGGTSGAGSTGRLARFKADTVNRLVKEHGIESVLELGCGDGQQLELLDIPDYTGVDVSPEAVEACSQRCAGQPNRNVFVAGEQPLPTVDMALSMDVLLHLVEDEVYEKYLHDLFGAATRLVVIYDADRDGMRRDAHVRHRNFTEWIAGNVAGWQLERVVAGPWPYEPESPQDTSDAGFHVYRPRTDMVTEVVR